MSVVKYAPSILGQKLLFETSGGLAVELERIAEDIVFDIKVALSIPYGGRHTRNPPPGPPQMRTGDLVENFHTTDARTVRGEPSIIITSPAAHRGRYYLPILVDKGYDIFPDVSFFA